MRLLALPVFGSQPDYEALSEYQGEGTEANPYIVSFRDKDQASPKNWSPPYKWSINILAALTMMTGTFAVSSYASGVKQMSEDLGCSVEVAKVGQTLFLNGLAFGSMIFPATADHFGRSVVIVSTMTIFAAFSIGVAAGNNIATVLVCRFFSGIFAAAGQALIPAQVSSLWNPKDIAVPFTTAAIAPFLGPSLGPLLGGYVVQYSKSWRNVNWLAMGMAGFFSLAYALFVPETFEPYILRQRALALHKQDGKTYVSVMDLKGRKTRREEVWTFLVRRLQYLAFEPIITIFTFYIAFIYGILNLFFESFPFIYSGMRGWSQGNAGLPFIALLIGFVFAVPVTLLFGRPYLKALKAHGKADPELRLPFAMLSAVLLPICLVWIGWSARPSISWAAPVVAGGVFGFSQIGLQIVYLADVYGQTIGAAFAGMNFIRFNVSSVFPLFAERMYDKLGAGWASSVLGFILVAFMPAPFLFYRYGPKIRSWSPTHPTKTTVVPAFVNK